MSACARSASSKTSTSCPRTWPPAPPAGRATGRSRCSRAARDGLDLLGWARIVARRAGGDRSLREVLIAAPHFSPRTRGPPRAPAERRARPCTCSRSRHSPRERRCFELESHPAPAKPSLIGGSTSLLARLLRVLEGAAAVSGAGGVRPAGSGLPDLRARRARRARLRRRRGGRRRRSRCPSKRERLRERVELRARSARSCTSWLVRLADGPAPSSRAAASRRDALVEHCADEAHAGVTAHSVPWNSDGSEPIDWVGVDIDGRPVVGAIRSTLGIRDVPALVAGWHLLDLEREVWTPGAVGLPRSSSRPRASRPRRARSSSRWPGRSARRTVPAAPARELP